MSPERITIACETLGAAERAAEIPVGLVAAEEVLAQLPPPAADGQAWVGALTVAVAPPL